MPGKRWASARPGGSHLSASRATLPSHESPSASNILLEVSKDPKFCSSGSSRATALKSESVLSTHGGDLTEEEVCVSPPPALLHGEHALNGNDCASVVVSQEDACAFHSPRSLPADSSDAGGAVIPLPPEEAPAGSLCADAVNNTEQPQRLPEMSDEGSASLCRNPTQRLRLNNQQTGAPSMQEAQQQRPNEVQQQQQQAPDMSVEQQQLLPEQRQFAMGSSEASALRRPSPPNESEGGWIRVEEPYRQATEAVNKESQTTCFPYQPSAMAMDALPSLPRSSSRTSREQVARYPICIGSATQAEEGTGAEHNSIGSITGMVDGEASEADGWEASSFPTSCTGTKPVQADRKGEFARLSLYARSVVCSLTDSLGLQQKEDPSNSSGADDYSEASASQAELSGREHQGKRGLRRRERLVQGLLEWHRCILEMYGGTVEDITRLALQVLPAHATGDEKGAAGVAIPRRFLRRSCCDYYGCCRCWEQSLHGVLTCALMFCSPFR